MAEEVDYRVKIGSVVKIFTELTTPAKYKLMIIVGMSDQGYIGVTLINSKLNTKVYPDSRTQDCVLPFEWNEDRRHYLEHDSYVDCNHVHPLKPEAVVQQLDEDFDSEALGGVSVDDLDRINEAIKRNITMPDMLKRYFKIID